MFRNTLTADDKYCFRDLEKLLSATQTEFSLKPKTFRHFFFFFFFCHFWNRHQILNILKKKMIVIAPLLRKLQAVKDLVRLLPKKQYFTKPFNSQHVKESQSLVKSA